MAAAPRIGRVKVGRVSLRSAISVKPLAITGTERSGENFVKTV